MKATKLVTKPAKQRKRFFQAPDHIRHRCFTASLSPELRASHDVNALPIRKGDTVRIMRGDHEGFEGKVNQVDTRKYRVYVEGLTREKVDGTTIFLSVHPSKIMITDLTLEDKWRKQVLERKRTTGKAKETIIEKPVSEEAIDTKKTSGKMQKKQPKKRKTRQSAQKKPETKPKKIEKVRTARKKQSRTSAKIKLKKPSETRPRYMRRKKAKKKSER